MKIKIICGYRKDQEHTIDINEAHKAYHLFYNPEKRAIFSNGLAIRGEQIQSILPDYVATMEWNEGHVLDVDDYNELEEKGITRKLRNAMSFASNVAKLGNEQDLALPLRELKKVHKSLLSGNRTYTTGRIGKLLEDKLRKNEKK